MFGGAGIAGRLPAEPANLPLRGAADGDARPSESSSVPASFADVVALFAEKREAVLAASLSSAVHLVHFETGRIDIRPTALAPADLATRVSRLLQEWTGRPWLVGLSRETGESTLREQALEREMKKKQAAAGHPLVQAVLAAFPGATIEAVRDLAEAQADEFDEADAASGDDE
jgi:DNA polymerase-3 subunit gamma/tau